MTRVSFSPLIIKQLLPVCYVFTDWVAMDPTSFFLYWYLSVMMMIVFCCGMYVLGLVCVLELGDFTYPKLPSRRWVELRLERDLGSPSDDYHKAFEISESLTSRWRQLRVAGWKVKLGYNGTNWNWARYKRVSLLGRCKCKST